MLLKTILHNLDANVIWIFQLLLFYLLHLKTQNMKKLRTIVVTILSLLIFIPSHAQEVVIENIREFTKGNSGVIRNGTQVKGYFFFYQVEKADKKNRVYEILVLDENLKETANQKITEPKTVGLLEATYNDNVILFKFYDSKAKKVIHRNMTTTGTLGDKVMRAATKQEIADYNFRINSDKTASAELTAAGKEMFVDVSKSKVGKFIGYSIAGISNNAETVWTYAPTTLTVHEDVSVLYADDKTALFLISSLKKGSTTDYKFSVLCLDVKSGEKKFLNKLQNSQYNMMAHNAHIDYEKSQIVLIGEYYDAKEKAGKSASDGVFVNVMDLNGGEVSESYIDWIKDVSPSLEEEDKKELKKIFIYFHNIVRLSNGNVMAIGEQYKKQVSKAGVAMNVLMGSNNTNVSMAEMWVGKFLLLTINSEYKLEAVKILDKKPNSMLMDESWTYVNQHRLAQYMAATGEFDFRFSLPNEDASLLSIGYVDREKIEGKGRARRIFHNEVYDVKTNTYTHAKMLLETEGLNIYALPNKVDRVLIYEFFRKAKQIKLHLEEIKAE